MYLVTIGVGLNASAKDRQWSSRKQLFFSRNNQRWVLGGMLVHLHICTHHCLVDREMRSACTCIVDSLPVLGMVQTKTLARLFRSKCRERFAKEGRKLWSLLQDSAHPGQAQVARANDGDCFLGNASLSVLAGIAAAATMAPQRTLQAKGRGDGVAEGLRKKDGIFRNQEY